MKTTNRIITDRGYDKWLARFLDLIRERKVATPPELEAAYESGVSAAEMAEANDRLAREYDDLLAEELAYYGK